MSFYKDIYINKRFFIAIIAIISLFILSYSISFLFIITQVLLFGFIGFIIIDTYLLFYSGNIESHRVLGSKFSNGDDNLIQIFVENKYPFVVNCRIIDEIPFQFQRRDINWSIILAENENKSFDYYLRPVKRGEYIFGKINVFVSGPIGFISRRFKFESNSVIPVYPSFLQQKQYEFLAFGTKLKFLGNKRVRRIGHSKEFEQIKDYIQGDDPRTINWKATARKGHLLVNQYQQEKSQPVYAIIDKGRLMKMPFAGLSLLDYSINATLALLSIAIKSDDKAGLISFSNKLSVFLKADKRNNQLFKISEALYNQKTFYKEPDFEKLNILISRNIRQRSLLILFTNFETFEGYKNKLRFLKALSKKHLLVVVFFKNTEIFDFSNKKASSLKEMYQQTIAENFIHQKYLIVKDLRQHGIISILSNPKDLSVKAINEYLRIKESGLL